MFIIQWQKELSGEVTIGWSKNAALPLIAASLLVSGKTVLTNIPDILDVHDFIHFLESIWCVISFTDHILSVDATSVSMDNMDISKIQRTRAGIYMIPGLLARFGEAKIPYPKGDKIGKRPIDEHVNGYLDMWFTFTQETDALCVSGTWSTQEVTTCAYFAVTATNNLIMWAAIRKGTTTIQLAAFEPHVFNLIDFLRKSWVQIDIRYDHTVIVHGKENTCNEIEHEVISDYLQSGTFIIIAALTAKSYIDIHRARIDDLAAFLYKLHATWVKTENLWNDTLRVYKAQEMNAINIQTNIFPGFPTDLMPLFSVLMTQCKWEGRIQEILYEGRLEWLTEYRKLWGKPNLVSAQEATIIWPTSFTWTNVDSWDLRSGAAMVIAGLIAEWETRVENIYWIKRGYENFLEKLQALGADIQDISK